MDADDLDPKRTLSQNSKLWPMLTDFAKQLDWPHTDAIGNWVISKMPPMSWKAVMTAAFEKEMSMAQGWEGGTVMVGASTSNYGIRKMADFITFLYAAGGEKGVKWSEKSEKIYQEFGSK
jgi:NinB protein